MRLKERNGMKVIPGGNQMSLIRDTEEVIKFLEFVGRKSMLPGQTVNCRLTACNNLFSVVQEEEDSIPFLLENLDVLTHRFRNLNQNVRASTLKVYKSRVKNSLEDFRAWSADPFLWERELSQKTKSQNTDRRHKAKKESGAHRTTALENKVSSDSALPSGARQIRFPIRPDFSVDITIPSEGLKIRDLHRIGMFLLPYCEDVDPMKIPWSGVLLGAAELKN